MVVGVPLLVVVVVVVAGSLAAFLKSSKSGSSPPLNCPEQALVRGVLASVHMCAVYVSTVTHWQPPELCECAREVCAC